jgi:hypothetical protein
MTISFSGLLSVGYSDQCLSDWGVREAGRSVCWHGAPVGAGGPYPGSSRPHRAAVLRRVGRQESSAAGIRRAFPQDGRVVPGVVCWAGGRSGGTGHGDGAVLSRAWSGSGRVGHRDRWRDGPDSPNVRGGHGRDRARRDSHSGDRAPGSVGAVRSRLPRACRDEKRLATSSWPTSDHYPPIRNLFTILWRWCTPFPAACPGCADTTRHSRTSWATVAGEGHPYRVLA